MSILHFFDISRLYLLINNMALERSLSPFEEAKVDKNTVLGVEIGSGEQDLRPNYEKFIEEIRRSNLKGKVLNVPSNSSRELKFYQPAINQSELGHLPLIAQQNDFYYYPSSVGFFSVNARKPSRYKLSNTNSIILSVIFSLFVTTNPSGFFFVADTNYSVDFYLSLFMYDASTNIQPISTSASLNPEFLSIKLKVVHQKDGSNPSLSYKIYVDSNLNEEPIANINLTDYIQSRSLINNTPDFNTDPEKATKQQYDLIQSKDVTFQSFFGYAKSKVDSSGVTPKGIDLLTGKDRVHFDLLFVSKFRQEYNNFSDTTGTSGSSNNLTDTNASWTTNQWAGGNYQVRIISGTGVDQTRVITANSSTNLTLNFAWAITPDNTSYYAIENTDIFNPSPLQFNVEGDIIQAGQMATFDSVNPA